MNDFSRELGQFEQQLENLSSDFTKIGTAFERLFDRIEADSKDTLGQIAKIRNDLSVEISKREDLEKRVDEFKKLAESNRKTINTEKLVQSNFETEVKAGIRVAKVMAGIGGLLATIISAVAAVIAVIK